MRADGTDRLWGSSGAAHEGCCDAACAAFCRAGSGARAVVSPLLRRVKQSARRSAPPSPPRRRLVCARSAQAWGGVNVTDRAKGYTHGITMIIESKEGEWAGGRAGDPAAAAHSVGALVPYRARTRTCVRQRILDEHVSAQSRHDGRRGGSISRALRAAEG